MSKFFFAIVIVTIVFIHCCDATGWKANNKQKSKPQSSYHSQAKEQGQSRTEQIRNDNYYTRGDDTTDEEKFMQQQYGKNW
ncbi:unnamed protein product [Meloidogyne enterolobii]|uniref:Uncharacterized protein n=1 Tax=Meloidogyne enterolobii TaxID=390850 RepID=A0ACB1ATC2_MELEN